ncbi:MAG: DUF455 family protein [Bdellovibrionaceae bacterium]|nr:DUF455 family protein [Pseudobdellovibrionaceae bacterium]
MLHLAAARDKLAFVRGLKQIPEGGAVPELPARDVRIVNAKEMPERAGLSTNAGQRRMLHDLANIELQAMELCYRSLIEYPDADKAFRDELMGLLESESQHFEMCLNSLQELGGEWGEYPVHIGLWAAVRAEDSILDRILIVHRYLEGNGLDAGETLIRRMSAVPRSSAHATLERIAREELDHVAFGSRWYQRFCVERKLDPTHDFKTRFAKLLPQMPRRIEHIQRDLRRQAGFSEDEIDFLVEQRDSWVRFKPEK